MAGEREKIPVLRDERRVKEAKQLAVVVDHAYRSAGDTPTARDDRAYDGCVLCGRSRREHVA